MAIVFYDGMPNVNEKLNELYTAFAAGPYNALPLTGGNLTGPVTSSSTISAQTIKALDFFYAGPAPMEARHGAYRNVGMAGEIFWVGRANTTMPCIAMNGSDGLGGWGTAGSVLYVGQNSATLRSINAKGTFNGSGADYAEYMVKCDDCGTVAPGQIVGIDGDGKVTDRWNMAISVTVKSTNPCMVGGDTWAAHLGPRPIAPGREDGDTDEHWRDVLDAVRVAQQA